MYLSTESSSSNRASCSLLKGKEFELKENESRAVVFIRNKQDVSITKTAKGFDVSIKGRWQGQDSEIFLSLKYIGHGGTIILDADEGSYMKGFRTTEPDFFDSPVTGLRIGSGSLNSWSVYPAKAVSYTRAQRKLVPQVIETIMPMIPVSFEDQQLVYEIELGFVKARQALRDLRRSKELYSDYEKSFEEACVLLKLDKMGAETLVVLGEEGGDIHLLAKSMDALLR